MINNRTLKNAGVKTFKIEGVEYFYVQDIKDNHPNLRVDTKRIIYVDEIPLIHSDYLHFMTDFDKTIMKTFKDKE